MSERRFGFVPDEADRAVLLRLCDIIDTAEKRQKPCFSSFLNEHEQAVAIENRVWQQGGSEGFFFGGFEEAQRKIFCALPQKTFETSVAQEDYPFKALTILFPKGFAVSHRDILGSIMALRIKREAVGDILVGDCLAVVFLLDAAARLCENELAKIGKIGVKCSIGMPDVLPNAYKTEQHEGVVSSLRIDAVVSMLTNLSRSESVKLISQKLVFKNSQEITSPSKEVAAEDKISVRGFGKYQIDAIGSLTKKGRLHIAYKKFI